MHLWGWACKQGQDMKLTNDTSHFVSDFFKGYSEVIQTVCEVVDVNLLQVLRLNNLRRCTKL